MTNNELLKSEQKAYPLDLILCGFLLLMPVSPGVLLLHIFANVFLQTSRELPLVRAM